MKKFVITLLACIAFAQTQAATPPLIESLLEYEAINNAVGSPSQTYIPETEFIIDIRRITHDVNVLGNVKYEILTRVPGQQDDHLVEREMASCGHGCGKSHHHNRTHTYIAKLLVEPNPGIGPNIVTVLSIKRVHD